MFVILCLLAFTKEWTASIRPDAKTYWDKTAVATSMLEAFSKLAGGAIGRALRPPYHWGGFGAPTVGGGFVAPTLRSFVASTVRKFVAYIEEVYRICRLKVCRP